MVQVILTHDNLLKKWEIHVSGVGVKDEKEARQAFYAAALTIQMLEPDLLGEAVVTKCPSTTPAYDTYSIEPAARPNSQTAKSSAVVINEVHAFIPTYGNSPDICRLCGRARKSQFHQL